MAENADLDRIPPSRGWSRRVDSAMLHVISLARYAMAGLVQVWMSPQILWRLKGGGILLGVYEALSPREGPGGCYNVTAASRQAGRFASSRSGGQRGRAGPDRGACAYRGAGHAHGGHERGGGRVPAARPLPGRRKNSAAIAMARRHAGSPSAAERSSCTSPACGTFLAGRSRLSQRSSASISVAATRSTRPS